MMKILVLDNYDSFTYNLVQLVEEITQEPVTVYRNDAFDLQELSDFDRILLSPGPGIPSEAGLMLPLIQKYAAQKPILGICLGHQAIAEVFGARLFNLPQVYHGVACYINLTTNDQPESIFNNIPARFEAGRYHSWAVERDSIPDELEITATDDQGMIMALRHRSFNVRGLQFHPESVLTPFGKNIIENWINA